MKQYIYLALIMVLLGCGNENNTQQQMATREQEEEPQHKTPVFTGTMDSAVLKQMFTHYITIKNALIDGNASAAAITGMEAFRALPSDSNDVIVQLRENFRHIGEIKDIEMQRQFFYPLSEYVFAITQKQKPDTATLYKQFCPMAFDDKGAWWISDEREIVNPYFGEEMLHCGMLQKEY